MKKLNIIFLIAIIMNISFFPLQAKEIIKPPEGDFEDNYNDDKSLIIFISGLAGKNTWTKLIRLLKKDDKFNKYDFLIYFSSIDYDISTHASRLNYIITEKLSNYTNKIFVAHSVGGIIAKSILMQESIDSSAFPKLIIFFGTPMKIDYFNIKLLKTSFLNFIVESMPELKKDVLDPDVIIPINLEWNKFFLENQNKINCLAVFGTNDKIAIAKGENNKFSILITGTHKKIVSPLSNKDCSFVVFKNKVLNINEDVKKLRCVIE